MNSPPTKKALHLTITGIFKIFAADTRAADKLIKKKSIDMIVGDLPYGIQHTSKKGSGKNEKTRNAEALFSEALPSWLKTLKIRRRSRLIIQPEYDSQGAYGSYSREKRACRIKAR